MQIPRMSPSLSRLEPVYLCRTTIMLLTLLLVGCVGPSEDQTTAQPPDSATSAADPESTDTVLLRNLAAIQKQPGVADVDWRQPKAVVMGAKQATSIATGEFVAPDALSDAATYHDQHGGRGLLVWHDGKLVGQHFADGFSADQHFASYSMHKSVLALALVAAVEDGIVESLDDRVGDYIKEWEQTREGDITLRELLTHSSGLQHFAMGGASQKATLLALSSKVSDTALTYRLDGEPGSVFNYNNVNSQILGVALERALARDERDYAGYLSTRLWQPLGNTPAALWLETENGSPRYFSGLEAGLTDWLRVGVMLLNGGRANDHQVISSSSVAQLTTPSANNPAYGLHLWLGSDWKAVRRYGPTTQLTVQHGEPYLAPDVWFFDGFGGQRVYVIPSAKLVVARAGEVNFAYDDSVILNTLLRGLSRARWASAKEVYNSDPANETYDARFARLLREARAGSGLAGYDPLIELPGAETQNPLPRAATGSSWLDKDAQDWLDQFGAGNNSSAIFIWHKGRVIYENYFNGQSADSLVISRSLSKPISVLAMGRAMKQGYIQSLDQPADQFIYEWQASDKSAMTLRHLLQMRSGLARQGNSMESDHFLNRAYLHPYHIEVIMHEYPLEHPPGTRYDYSNANSELIAPIIERATGRRYEEWVSEAVFEPLGAKGGQIWVNRKGGTTHSGCCALLPAETFLRLSVLILNDGVWEGERLLPEGFVETITTSTEYNLHTGMGMYVAGPYIRNRGAANPDVPYGHTLHSEPYLDKDLYLFDGNGHQVSYHIPRHEMIILRVGVRPPEGVIWDNSELPNFVLRQYASATGAKLVPQPGPEAP